MKHTGRKRTPAVQSPRMASMVAEVRSLTRQLRLALRELHAPQEAPSEPLAALWEWWSAEYLPRRQDRRSLAQWWADYLAPRVAELTAATLTPAVVEQLLAELDERLAPRTVNGVRGLLSKLITDAAANGRWARGNPVDATRSRRVQATRWPTLSFGEARKLLATARPPDQLLFALSIFLSLRKGESFALRRGDFDLAEGTVFVRRSHERRTTKNGRNRLLPLVPELRELVELHLAQLEERGEPHELGPLLFPNASGGLRRRDDKTSRKLRAALRAAGVVTGYTGHCRACGTRAVFPDAGPRRCEACGRAIWHVAIPKKLRFYDLRHTFASLAREAGVEREARRIVLGHVPDVSGRYDQWTTAALREELSKMHITRSAAVAEKVEAPRAGTLGASGSNSNSPGGERESERERRFELPTRSLGSTRGIEDQVREEKSRRIARFEQVAADVESRLEELEPTLAVTISHRGAKCPCGARGAFRLDPPDGEAADYCGDCFTRVLAKFRKDSKGGGR